MRTINVTDITLKKLSEDREISLLFREKSAIANCADTLGVTAVELPAVKNLREEVIRLGGEIKFNTQLVDMQIRPFNR